MIGSGTVNVKCMVAGVTSGSFCFSPNTSSDPDSTYTQGDLKRFITSIVYSATGIYTVTFTDKFLFPSTKYPMFTVSPQVENMTEHFAVCSQAYVAATRTLIINSHRNGTARIVPASTGAARIVVSFSVIDSQGG